MGAPSPVPGDRHFNTLSGCLLFIQGIAWDSRAPAGILRGLWALEPAGRRPCPLAWTSLCQGPGQAAPDLLLSPYHCCLGLLPPVLPFPEAQNLFLTDETQNCFLF